ncbi:putative aat family amino acid transporter [Rosellinia necatrix]|uniref:Putative aat family amino acid transporter n=1 Tax=Rosellinia necatrix TaxID=77044 RepID=A0A1S8A9C3_ROSNE|nr:putative aat family amino acid transporter [Rosellinia necatrix]
MPSSYSSRDIEMSMFPIKEDSLGPASSYTMREPVYEDVTPPSALGQFIDGFRRDPTQRITPKDPLNEIHDAEAAHLREPMLPRNGSYPHYYDLRQATLQTAQSHLARKLKGRHLQMIAIGGSIGMGSV